MSGLGDSYICNNHKLDSIFLLSLLSVMLFFLYKFLTPKLFCMYQPQSKNGVNSFGGLGATIVDSLDTLYIMGLHEQFQKARE